MNINHLVQTRISEPLVFTNVIRKWISLYQLLIFLSTKPHSGELECRQLLKSRCYPRQSLNS